MCLSRRKQNPDRRELKVWMALPAMMPELLELTKLNLFRCFERPARVSSSKKKMAIGEPVQKEPRLEGISLELTLHQNVVLIPD